MKIMNIMLSRILGGIEQSFVDYEKIINLSGNTSVNIISPNAKIASKINNFETVPNYFRYDPITLFRLRQLFKKHQTKFIIAHGSRIMNFANLAKLGLGVKVIGISHQYKPKPLFTCDHVIAITDHMKEYLIQHGIESDKITVIPNTIEITQDYVQPNFRTPPIIGTMARLVKKKGIDDLLHAFKILKDKGVQYRGIIGGGGEEEKSLKKLCTELGLDDVVTFVGWVKDKKEFFDSIDVFCLPSTHEPFGIIALEAMLHSKPIVTSDSEGPLQILKDNVSALFYPKMNIEQLADRMCKLISDPALYNKFAQNAYLRVSENYAINKAAEKFQQLVTKLI
jgi:glycosyltransferase involved in cell wall biosynthesis